MNIIKRTQTKEGQGSLMKIFLGLKHRKSCDGQMKDTDQSSTWKEEMDRLNLCSFVRSYPLITSEGGGGVKQILTFAKS